MLKLTLQTQIETCWFRRQTANEGNYDVAMSI